MQPARRNAIRLPNLFVLPVIFALFLAGCGATATPLSASIAEPVANSTFQIGESITISGKASGTGIKMLDLYVNTTQLARTDQPSGENEFSLTLKWTPDVSGPVYLLIKGLNEQGESIVSSDPVFITIEGQPTPAAPPPTEIPAPTAVPTQPPPPPAAGTQPTTTAPAAGAAPGAPAPATGAASVVPTGDFANLRKGPGLTYDIVGTLQTGQSLAVKGKSDDGAWWQVNYTTAPEGVAWVNGQVVTFTGDASKIAVAKAPPAPTAAPVAAAPAAPAADVQIVPIGPTAAPAVAPTPIPAAAALPYAQSVAFDPPNPDFGLYNAGQQVTVRWNIQGATSASIEIVGKPAPGLYKDCPAGNTGAVSPPANRTAINLPEGNFPFTITSKGYYELTIYVTKADGQGTTIPFPVSVQCYK